MKEKIVPTKSFIVVLKSRFHSLFVRGLIEGKNCLIGLCFLGCLLVGVFVFVGVLGGGG